MRRIVFWNLDLPQSWPLCLVGGGDWKIYEILTKTKINYVGWHHTRVEQTNSPVSLFVAEWGGGVTWQYFLLVFCDMRRMYSRTFREVIFIYPPPLLVAELPEERQTLLYSATLTDTLASLKENNMTDAFVYSATEGFAIILLTHETQIRSCCWCSHYLHYRCSGLRPYRSWSRTTFSCLPPSRKLTFITSWLSPNAKVSSCFAEDARREGQKANIFAYHIIWIILLNVQVIILMYCYWHPFRTAEKLQVMLHELKIESVALHSMVC